MIDKRIKDLSRMRFQRLEVLSYAGKPANGRGALWLCRCDCGVEKIISAKCLQGGTQSCGGPTCLQAKNQTYPVLNSKYGMLTALEFSHTNKKGGGVNWRFLCDCGESATIRWYKVRDGIIDHCGCKTTEKSVLAHVKDKDKNRDLAPMRDLMQTYKNNANQRNLRFELTENQFYFLTQQNCFFCAKAPANYKKVRQRKFLKNGQPFLHNGVDRWHAHIGYTVENCVPCCMTCNYAKRSMSGERFIEWMWNLRNHAETIKNNLTEHRETVVKKLFELDNEF